MPLIRARDVRDNIAVFGFEKGVVASLEQLLDEYAETRQHMRELTELVSKCVDEVQKMIYVGDGLRRSITEIKRVQDQGDHIDGKPEG
jgi:uncharacterized protein Yka (UPF0111/DUF47 family)